ncbi:universal stress protein [Rhodoferax sp.]|uniref:universal stress protein n=1 Tax=Rhodoferax sp. TaxID=50421 RepID=UPI0025CFC721|nr:universal stress protein [Rhodoferax sp.]MCM2340544.1 universal stress protein [Rhodoferax sp.]
MNTSWLIALDGSEPSLKAIDYVITEATSRVSAPQLFLVNVQAPLSSDITRFIDEKVVDDFHREAGDAALAPARQKLDAAGLAYSAHIMMGEAAPTIVEFATDKGCSQIVMGAHGFGSVVGLFLGSVTTKVVKLATVPVLVVK